MDSYWELYLAYIQHCERQNKQYDIDPHHYKMEWNHTLPRCIFGDQPLGQWLTLKQHAIASALQSLAFNKNCMFGWHKHYLSPSLFDLAWPIYRSTAREKVLNQHLEKDEKGRSLMAVKASETLLRDKNEEGKSINAIKGGKKGGAKLHEGKDEFGRSLHIVKVNEEKDATGKSINAVKGGKKGGRKTHERKDELGRSVNAVRAAERMNKMKWRCKVTGYISTPGPLSVYQRARGICVTQRERLL